GICYSMQLMAKHFGGVIERTEERHDGTRTTWVLETSELYAGLDNSQQALLTHGDTVVSQPSGFHISATCGDTIVGIEKPDQKLYATQFHPESANTLHGTDMMQNFLRRVAGIEPYLDIADLETEAIDYIQNYVGVNDVMLFLSGGV